MRLENWAILFCGDAYTPPECISQRATGSVHDSEKFEDGEIITTSSIKEINLQEKYIITASGNKYLLGQPKPEWVEFLKENNKKYYQTIMEGFDVEI